MQLITSAMTVAPVAVSVGTNGGIINNLHFLYRLSSQLASHMVGYSIIWVYKFNSKCKNS